MNLKFTGEWSLWAVIPAAIVFVVVAVWLYRRELRRRTGPIAWILPTIRSAIVALVILMLAGPVLHKRKVVGELTRVLVCADASASMSLSDHSMKSYRKLYLASRMGWISDDVLPRGLMDADEALYKASRLLDMSVREGLDTGKRTATAERIRDVLKEGLDTFEDIDTELIVSPPSGRGKILYEYWSNVRVNSAADFFNKKELRPPDGRELVDTFATPANRGDNFVGRLRGYLCPPETGNYHFWVTSDDDSRLFISDGPNPANKKSVLHRASHSGRNDWPTKSKPVSLKAGSRYYVEAVYREGSGEDHLAVGWTLPDGSRERPIEGRRLYSYRHAGEGADVLTRAAEAWKLQLIEEAAAMTGTDDKAPGDEDFMAAAGRLRFAIGQWRDFLQSELERLANEALESGNISLVQAIEKIDKLTRWERINELLLGGSRPLLETLAEKHNVELMRFSHVDSALLWRGMAGMIDESAAIPDSLGSPPQAMATDISRPLMAAVAERKAAGPDEDRDEESAADSGRLAVVLLTDGRHNLGGAPVGVAESLGRQGINIFTVGVGTLEDTAVNDLAIAAVSLPPSLYYKDRVKGRVHLKDGMEPGRDFVLRLVSDETVLWEKAMKTKGVKDRRVEFDFPLEEFMSKKLETLPGDVKYRNLPLEIEARITFPESTSSGDGGKTAAPADTESRNDTLTFYSRAMFQKLRMLVLAGRPRWEIRYIRNMFQRDEKWDVTCLIADPDKKRGGINRGEEGEVFPATREGLFGYDVIVLGEFHARLLTTKEWQWLSEFVSLRGGGLVMVDGRRGALKSLAGSPVGPAIPVSWAGGEGDTEKNGTVVLMPTERGWETGMFDLVSEDRENGGDNGSQEVWREFKPPKWISRVQPGKGCEVLLQGAVAERDARPVIVLRRYGAGKVLFSAVDETWRWRYKVGNTYHDRFWHQVSKWVMERPFAASDRYTSVDIGDLKYTPGRRVDVRARVRGEDGRPLLDAIVKASLMRDGKKVSTVPLAPQGRSGLYFGKTAQLGREGEYEVRLDVAGIPDDRINASTTFYVEKPVTAEMTELTCGEGLLKQVAEKSGGEYLPEENIGRLETVLEPLSQGRIVESDLLLWQHYLWFGAIILLLTIEWIIRKRAGML